MAMVDNEAYAIALKDAINEVREICPEIRHVFLFSQNGELFMGDGETPERIIFQVKNAFCDVFERAEALGGVESATIEGEDGFLRLSRVSSHYLVLVASGGVEMERVSSVVRILTPTVQKLLEGITPTPMKGSKKPETAPLKADMELAPKPAHKTENQALTEKTKAVQLMVEDLRGLFIPSDTVRIDSETLLEWEKASGKSVELVDIETFSGKTLTCKVKPIKDPKYFGKGVVQMPDKVQEALETKKGELVKVKPSILN